MFSKYLVLPAAAAATLTFAAPASASTQTVTLRFAAVAGDTPVACGTPVAGLGTTNATAQIQDLRFYVSRVRLLRADGSSTVLRVRPNNEFRTKQAAGSVSLIDLENAKGACAASGTPSTNRVVVGTAPKGKYTGVQFTLGVPFGLNHINTPSAPAPLNSTAMAWSWQSGRKFTKIEVSEPTPASWKAKLFTVHLGSTGCTGNPATGQTVACKTPNRATVTLKSFNAAKQSIALDLKSLFVGNDVTVNNGGAPGCMSGPTDPECAGIFSALGLSWAADGTGTGLPTTGATFFRAIQR